VAIKQQQVMLTREKKEFCFVLMDLMGAERAEKELRARINQLSSEDETERNHWLINMVSYAEMLRYISEQRVIMQITKKDE
jgi:ubiquitin C-terminal hydrolase